MLVVLDLACRRSDIISQGEIDICLELNFYIVLYCIVLYCIVLYCIVLYCIVLYGIVLYCIVLYCIVLYCIPGAPRPRLRAIAVRPTAGFCNTITK